MLKPTQGQKKVALREEEIFNNEVFKKKLQSVKGMDDIKERREAANQLAKEYNLDISVGTRMFKESAIPALNSDRPAYDLDVCRLVDAKSSREEELAFFEATGKLFNKRELNVFPVHLMITPEASKRDVLDFINKNWQLVQAYMEKYKREIPVLRKRPNKERDERIWELQHLGAKIVAEKINKEFSNTNFSYADVNKILHRMRKKRKSDLV